MKKKMYSVVLAILLVALFATGCSGKTENKTEASETSISEETVSTTDYEETKDNQSKADSSEAGAEKQSESNNSSSSLDDAEWKQFLKDYEEWVDDYIAIVKKYKANPTDTSILADYTNMVSEMADWTDKADEIESELEDSEAAAEYASELLRIANKLSEAVS